MTAARNYETTYILTPEAEEAERTTIKGRVKEIIEEQFGGNIVKVDDWGRRELAYDIKKQNFGYYVHTRYVAPANCIVELERILRLTDPVIKFLTIRVDDKTVAE
jgi:small subunit ribosomal protein S6